MSDDDDDFLDGLITGWVMWGDAPKGFGGFILLILIITLLIILHYNGYL